MALAVLVVLLDVALCSLALLKGRITLGLIGLFIPLLALVAAIRLARPRSPWARWRYGGREAKLERARERYRKADARSTRWRDLIGGAPNVRRG